MTTEELRRLAERAADVEGRQSDRLAEVHGRIRAARRRRTAAGAAAAAGVAIALVVGGAAVTGSTDRTNEPIDQKRTPKPTPTKTVELPAGQQTITPDIGAGDIRGWELRGSRTNKQPGLEASTDLTLTVETGGLYTYSTQSYVAPFCNGDPDTWWVLTMDIDGDGEQNPDPTDEGTRSMFGACSEDDPTAVPPPTGTIGPWQWDEAPMSYPLRMFVTDALSLPAQRCLRTTTDTDSCLAAHQLAPLPETAATFGFGVYEHLEAPTVMEILGGAARFQALAIADGVEYLVDKAVLSAEGAPRLVVRLPESDRSRIVAVYAAETAATRECDEDLGFDNPSDAAEEQAQVEEVERTCGWELQLRLDGQVPRVDDLNFSFAEQQVVLPPGDAGEVTVDVVSHDPSLVRYAVVIWKERS